MSKSQEAGNESRDSKVGSLSNVLSIDRDDVFRSVKEGLLSLNGLYISRWEESEADGDLVGAYSILERDRMSQELNDRLNELSVQIDYLWKKYPNDPDLLVLQSLHDDLVRDLQNWRVLKLDEGFDEAMELVNREINYAGVQVESPDASLIPSVIAELREAGIEPEYVVTNGDPDAKVLVYFMQSHPNPGIPKDLLEAFGVFGSQKKIYENLDAAISGGMSNLVYAEGSKAYELESHSDSKSDLESTKKYAHGSWLATDKINVERNEEVEMVGMENLDLLTYVFEMGGMRYRMTAHNIILASNIDAHFKSADQRIAFAVLGGAHEKHDIDQAVRNDVQDMEMPFSRAMAYYGYNVVVVDAVSKYFDINKFDKAVKRMKREMEEQKSRIRREKVDKSDLGDEVAAK